MITSRHSVRRVLVVLLAAVSVVLVSAGAAAADTPAAWDDSPDVSGLDFLLVLVLIPAGLSIVIAILAALPSMIGDKGYEPGQAWRSEPEWFGGASDAADGEDAPEALDQGGASGRW